MRFLISNRHTLKNAKRITKTVTILEVCDLNPPVPPPTTLFIKEVIVVKTGWVFQENNRDPF